jgi:NADH-quinone oxidoreductase subunit F
MNKKMTLDELTKIKNNYLAQKNSIPIHINICAGTGCIASGALKVFEEFQKQLKNIDMNVVLNISEGDHKHPQNSSFIVQSGCHGFCQMGPLVDIAPLDVLYTNVKAENVSNIIEQTIKNNVVIEELLYKDNVGTTYQKAHEIPFYALQMRNTLDKCGSIDSTDIKAYIAKDGYLSAYNVYNNMNENDVINIMLRSGLRGRGGAGFPTGKK